MAIDLELRRTGIGASEIAAVLDLSPYADPFSVYISKVDPLPQNPNAVQRRGKYFERGVVDWYSDLTGRKTEWFDRTIVSPVNPWMLASPDAWIIEAEKRVAECQAKTVNWRNIDEYGEQGGDDVPTHVGIQCQWTMSVADTPYAAVAALCGMDDLRIYQIWRDQEIEAVLLEEGDKFWRHHVLARNPPRIGYSATATEWLKRRFPRNVEPLRCATNEEHAVLELMRDVDLRHKKLTDHQTSLENEIKLFIGAGEGVLDGPAKVTYRMCKDTLGTDWEAVARETIELLAATRVQDLARVPEMIAEIKREMVGKHCVTLKEGSRRLVKIWRKK